MNAIGRGSAVHGTRRIIVAVVLAAALLVLAGCSSPSSTGSTGSAGSTGGTGASNTVSVSLKNFAFNPSEIAVPVGGTVTFTNDDSTQHNVAGAGWSSGPLDPGKTFSQTFPTAGTFPIKCTIHPSMTANVTVK